MTRLASRLTRLEDVMAQTNKELIRIKVEYIGVNKEAAGGYG